MDRETLIEYFRYDPDTGDFFHTKKRGNMRAGSKAGTINKVGYCYITHDNKPVSAHRMAYLYVHGEIPDGCQIDHIDGNKSNNAISNLRAVPHSINMHNIRRPQSNNKTGALGVSTIPQSKKFKAAITVNGKHKHIGMYETVEEAHQAYLEVKRKVHAGCTL